MRYLRRSPWVWFVAGGTGLALLGAACSGGNSTPARSPVAPPVSTPTSVAAAGSQPVIGVQSADPAPPPDTSKIPTSYTPKAGDLLFYTNGSISYNSTAKHPWVVVIDAKTKQIVAASEIGEVSSSPHGLGVSPDGKLLYLPAGIGSPIPALGSAPGEVKFGNGVTVISGTTLKMVQAIETVDAPHHIQVLNDRDILSDAWGTKQILFTLDPASENKMTHELSADAFGGRPYIAFPSPDGKYIYMTVRPAPGSTEKEAWISRVKLDDWSIEKVADVGAGAASTRMSRSAKRTG